jgi:hypothetical protein
MNNNNDFGLFYKRHMTFKTWVKEFSLDIFIVLCIFSVIAYLLYTLFEVI